MSVNASRFKADFEQDVVYGTLLNILLLLQFFVFFSFTSLSHMTPVSIIYRIFHSGIVKFYTGRKSIAFCTTPRTQVFLD